MMTIKKCSKVAIDTAREKGEENKRSIRNNNSQKNAENKGDAVTTKEVRLRQGNRREKNDFSYDSQQSALDVITDER
jgi:hypothetical protein